jgi:hypothetical protein
MIAGYACASRFSCTCFPSWPIAYLLRCEGAYTGQSCFYFIAVDQNCLAELEKLTHAGFLILKNQALL